MRNAPQSQSLNQTKRQNAIRIPTQEPAKILIVDDSAENLDFLETILTIRGHEVEKCDRATVAIKRAKASIPDLILLDINMPEIAGVSVCRLLQQHSVTSKIPVVFITVIPDLNNKARVFKLGGNDYITQPFEIEEVIVRVESQLKFCHLQAELEAKNKQLEMEIKRRQAMELKLLELNQKLHRMAIVDGLTNISNRRHFDKFLMREWQRGKREQFSLGLILGDIDYFQLYNDRFGHQKGDICLKKVARAIASSVNRPGDLVARYEGEKFAIILPRTSAENALLVAEKIRLAVKALNIYHPGSLVSDRISLSLGVSAVMPSSDSSSGQLLVTADKALNLAQDRGYNCSVLSLIAS
ncbi:MAG: diguanylate cyclase [Cyanobacteria bacterium J06623_7]